MLGVIDFCLERRRRTESPGSLSDSSSEEWKAKGNAEYKVKTTSLMNALCHTKSITVVIAHRVGAS